MGALGTKHSYTVDVEWTGNRGEGTATYRSYGRDHIVTAEQTEPIAGSADPTFRGDPTRWNPEQLLLVATSQCHMLSYLHQAASNGVVVVAYRDQPTAVMTEDGAGGGRFTEIMLHPVVTISDPGQVDLAESLHAPAGQACFVAASLNLPVGHDVVTLAELVNP